MAKSKVLPIALGLALLLNLIGSTLPTSPAVAAPAEVKWSRVNIPTEGATGNWVLASGSNVRHLTMAVDGTLYGYTNPSGTSYTLFKSTDAGYSWSPTGKVTDTIVDIAAAPDDASTVYYATAANIYKSDDAGLSFNVLPLNPGGAGSNNIEITSLDVAQTDSSRIIAVGTKDTDNAQYGGIYTLNENEPFTGWTNTGITSYDVLATVFSPNFATDRQLVAVVTDETNTLVTTKIGNGGWGGDIGDATIAGLAATSAAIAFPDDHDATTEDYILFVAIDSGSNNGDVYMVNGVWAPGSSTATDLDIGATYNLSNVDVTGLVIQGSSTTASLMAGTANGAQVYISTDSGLNWTRSGKAPTGQSQTHVLMAPGFASSGRAYVATSGAESAFSYTTDGGTTWNQISLIDTKISANGIIDLAVSSNYSQDNTLFLLTFDGEHIEHSLWRSLTGGNNWERVFTSTTASANSLNLVELSPQSGGGNQVVFLADTSSSQAPIWKSIDNGQTFSRRSASFSIDTWAVVSDNTLFLGSYDGSNGLVYRTTNSGLSYSTGTVVGSQPLVSIATSPNYEPDESILAGNKNGQVYWSNDNGITFGQLGQQLPLSATGQGRVTIAFDPKFGSNRVVYAVSDAKVTSSSKERIHRFIIGQSDTWESIDSTLPVNGTLNQITVSADGTLYASNSQSMDTTEQEGGMQRSLNPTYPLGPTSETVIRGLDDGASLIGLWLRGNQLWSIDSQNTRLMTYIDSLARPVTLTSPATSALGTGISNVNLDWEPLKGATEYKWQLNYDTDFSTIATDFETNTKKSSARMPALDTATTYLWRVRATEPVLSRWSAKWSFTTSLGATILAPELYAPKAGTTGVSRRPVFQWSALAEAESYELLVATEASFSSPLIVKIGDYSLPATAWQSDISLDYNTAYYWKVRAGSASSYSGWSAVGAFTTELPPSPPAAPEIALPPTTPLPAPLPTLSPSLLPPSPAPPQVIPIQSTLPDWVMYLTAVLLLTIVLLLVTLLMLVLKIKRP